jgi:hypothetical protein
LQLAAIDSNVVVSTHPGMVSMGKVLRFPRHARASALGRGTSEGQSQPSGQRSENQAITSSYLRAVKVVDPSVTRSKKRQSPAAKRPRVVKLSDRAAAYAEAQAIRFERSSVSMTADHSRSFPTTQEKKVGNFQLAVTAEVSDKSAMPTVEQIRRTIVVAMERAGEGAVSVAVALGLERNHLRDFLEGKKRSLKTEVTLMIAERYGIPFKDLVITKDKAARRSA